MASIASHLLILLFLTGVIAFYQGNTPVQLLTERDFSKTKKGAWLVQFYAPWCGHCQALAPQYQKAAKALKGIAHIAAVDATKQNTGVSVSGYPTIKFFNDGVESDYNGQRTASGIISFMFDQLKKIAYSRIGESDTSSGDSDFNQKDVVVLQQSNFETLVMNDEFAWFVQFYAPWCGHCKKLAPEWAELATNLKGQIKVGKVDATVNKQLASRYGVNGYPSIKFFPAGKKSDDLVQNYQGARTASSMTEWGRQNNANSKVFDLKQLTSQSIYDESCKSRNLCVIIFVPHLLDSSESERQTYLQTIKQVGLKFRGKPFTFLWSQGGDQYDFEESFGAAGSGYPSVIVISNIKRVSAKMKKSFSADHLSTFVKQILENKGKFVKFRQEPAKLKTVAAYISNKVTQDEDYSDYGKKKEGCDEHVCTAPPPKEQQL